MRTIEVSLLSKFKARHKRKLIIIGVFLVGVLAVCVVNPYSLKLTMSESVDHSVFVINSKAASDVGRGDYVSVLAPNDPESGTQFVKLIAGVAGDVVRVEGRDVYVADVYVGRAKEKSLTGRALEAIKGGVIPEGQYYLYAPHKDSYDSRYAEIGFVSSELIVGRAKPLL